MKHRLLIPLLLSSTVCCSAQCDTSLWQHVYHPNRLKVIKRCITVTGTVMKVRKEMDGDYHIMLRLNGRADTLLNEKNYSDQDTCLVVEIVCACKVTQEDAKAACQGFNNIIQKPARGEHVIVTGDYVLDSEHGWMEIHPVSKIVKK